MAEVRRLLSCVSTACNIGIIIAVVAVLLIHIDRNAVVDMNPNIKLYAHTQYGKQNKPLFIFQISETVMLEFGYPEKIF